MVIPKAVIRSFVWVSLTWGAVATLGARVESYANLREQMVETQVAARGVKDLRVLAAMRKVERHRFVPAGVRARAYEDVPLPIGYGQTISQPYIVALMSELLELKGNERVLEVGTGSGYQAAILAELAQDVFTIEILPDLARTAAERLKGLGYESIHVRQGDGYKGWPEAAPFDAILVTCAPDRIPEPLVQQLKKGGRFVIPVGDYPNQVLYRIDKTDGKLIQHPIIPVRFVPMTGEAEKAPK